MPYRTITEKYGTLTCRSGGGLPPDTVFGTPVKPTTFLPMIGPEDLFADPGWFSPKLMEIGLGIYPLEPEPQAPELTP